MTYNTFPLMDGRIAPRGYAALEPFWLNWFETIEAVQFNHRFLAIVTAFCALLIWFRSLREEEGALRVAGLFLGLAAVAQVGLGALQPSARVI